MSPESIENRLERGELVVIEQCPFSLPEGADRQTLMTHQVGRAHKNVSFDPGTGRVSGHRSVTGSEEKRLSEIMSRFTTSATMWLTQLLPSYARDWQLDRASLRPEEEATRRLRHSARNDLLHIDAFPSRPSFGRRLLRLYINIDPDDARVWATSETFPKLLSRYTAQNRLPSLNAAEWCKPRLGLQSVLRPGSPYDTEMLRLHHFLKRDDDFQERAAKRIWQLPPNSAWLLFADSLSHAVLRGRCALECSFFVPVNVMRDPTQAPVELLARSGRAGIAA